MRDLLNVGVIGCGYWGPNLIRNLNALLDCSVKTICDKSLDRLEHMQKLYRDVKTATNADVIINDPDIDAVVIATPVYTHYELAIECLMAGKHTFIEKPMASSVMQCKELVETAERNNLTLMTGHTFIYSSPVRKVKDILDSGEIGDLL